MSSNAQKTPLSRTLPRFAQNVVRTEIAKRGRALMTPLSQLGMLDQITGMDVGTETWRRMHDMKQPEFQSLIAGNFKDISKFNIADATAQKWADFIKRLDEASASIFKTFVTGLEPLATPLTNLSKAFETFLTTIFQKDGIAQQAVDGLAGWLNSFSGKISKPEFLKSVEEFTSGVGSLAQAINGVVGNFKDPTAFYGRALASTHSSLDAIASRGLFNLNPTQRGFTDRLALLEQTYKLPKGLLAYEAMKETGMSFDAKYNKPNAKGAAGIFQLTPIALKEIYDKANLKIDPTDPLQSAIGAAVYNKIQLDRFHGDARKTLAAYNWGPENVDFYGRTGRGARGQPMPGETRDYVSGARITGSGSDVTITINNNTGGSAIVTANQLAY